MPLSTAPALLIGIGARILLDAFTRSGAASIRDFVLIGVWQGVGLHYAASKNPSVAIILAVVAALKLFVEFNMAQDTTRTAITILGVALGILCTEWLSQFFRSPHVPDSDRRRKKSMPTANASRRDRLVQFRAGPEGDASDARHKAFRNTVTISDITSVDSNSEMIGPSASMTPLDREIAILRTRASLADSERRRFKEERKWAISQGNEARASQMKWQVKRYTALMQSFHREADAKLIEASGGRPRLHGTEEPKLPSSSRPSRHRKEISNGQAAPRSVDAPLTRSATYKQAARDAVR